MTTMYITIEDPQFDQTISLRDAYRIMYSFALEYERRGDLPVSAFTLYAGLLQNGCSADPAALYDFLEEARRRLPPRAEQGENAASAT